MKILAIVDPGRKLKEIEDALIVYWQQKGSDLDYDEVVGGGKAFLAGEDAVSADSLIRSIDIPKGGMNWVFLRGACQSGSLLEPMKEMFAQAKNDMPVFISYERYYDIGVTKQFSKMSKDASRREYWQLIPSLAFTYDFSLGKTEVFLGQVGGSPKAWASLESSNEFRARITEFAGSSEFWGNAIVRNNERRQTTSAVVNIEWLLDQERTRNVISEVDGSLYGGSSGVAERLRITCSARPEAENFLERCKEIVLRRYEKSLLFADILIINPVAMYVHKLRAIKDEVFGTAFENLEIPLMTSSWKGTKFTAKRVFENGRHLIRMRLAGKEDVCRALLKEMEEELGVEIKIESCK